jgi:hypothetical protein
MDRERVWSAAERLNKRYGEQAPTLASRKAKALLEQGRTERRKDWLRIMVASNALLQMEPRAE